MLKGIRLMHNEQSRGILHGMRLDCEADVYCFKNVGNTALDTHRLGALAAAALFHAALHPHAPPVQR